MAKSVLLLANDSALHADNYLRHSLVDAAHENSLYHLTANSLLETAPRIWFNRPFGSIHSQWQYRLHPGASVTVVSNAEAASALVVYPEACSADCPGVMPKWCYVPEPNCSHGDGDGDYARAEGREIPAASGTHHVMCGGPCPNHCALKLYVDGVRRALPSPPRAHMHGFTTVALLHHTGDAAPPNRTLELVMPRGGHVELVGLRLSVARAPALEVRRPHWRPHAAFRWLAYGDSITQGFCADTPYPEIIGRENGWRDINAGISGLFLGRKGQGTALSRSKADLVTILLGTNDFSSWCMKPPEALPCDAGAKLATVLDEFRAVQPRVPIAVITPLTRRDEGHATCCVTLEGARQQLKAEVVKRQVRGDANLVVVDGPPLLPAAALDGDGIHPRDDAAARDLAFNLNAALGFSRVRAELAAPSCAPLRLRASGLTPHGEALVFYARAQGLAHWRFDAASRAAAAAGARELDGVGCGGRSIMLAHDGVARWRADEHGRASGEIKLFAEIYAPSADACAAVVFQVLDAASCVTSRVGRVRDGVGDWAFNATIAKAVAATRPDALRSALAPRRLPAFCRDGSEHHGSGVLNACDGVI